MNILLLSLFLAILDTYLTFALFIKSRPIKINQLILFFLISFYLISVIINFLKNKFFKNHLFSSKTGIGIFSSIREPNSLFKTKSSSGVNSDDIFSI